MTRQESPVTPPEEPAADHASTRSRARARVDGIRSWAQSRFDRYRDLPLVGLALGVVKRDQVAAGAVVGSAVAFRLFLFFVPFALFVVGLTGFVSGTIGPDDVDSAGIGGSAAVQINAALDQPNSTRWVAVLTGLVGMLTAGRTLSKTMVQASLLAWQLPSRPKASARLIGGLLGAIVGIALMALIVNRIRSSLGIGVAGMSFVAALVVYVVAWVVVFSILPRARAELSVVLPGAALMALTITGMQAVSQLYLPDRFSKASHLYGALGSTVVILGWFFFMGRAIVLAMILNASVYERFGSITEFVFALPVLRAIAARSPWVRRTFGLADPEPADAAGADQRAER